MDVAAWLQGLGLERYVPAFRDNEIDWDAQMSATSTAGRDNGCASAGHLQQEVEGARHLAERVDGDACVERRRVEFLMSQ
jgi:hypothetical protein